MPSCYYIVSRTYLRVDSVILRVRETRIFHEFKTKKIIRNITWRECPWSQLQSLKLPTDVKSWTGANIEKYIGRLPLLKLPASVLQDSWICLD